MTRSPSELAAFLRSHRREILERWHASVKDRPETRALSRQQLIDHLPDLLEAIAETGEDWKTDPSARLTTESAERHALERLLEGLDLSHVVIELAVLRDSILAVWDEQHIPVSARPEVRFLNRSIDRAITASVDRYTAARDRTLRSLDQISTAALESRRLDDFLERLLQVLVDTTAAVDTGAIFLRDGDDVVARAVVGLEDEAQLGVRFRIGVGFPGRIAAERRPRLMSDAELGEVVSPLLRAKKLRCLYGVPLTDGGAIVGVAHIGSLSAADFSDQDKELFQAVAARAGAGIVQHQFREDAQRRAAELMAVIESIPDPVLVGGPKGISIANTAALALLSVASVEEINQQSDTLAGLFELRQTADGQPLLPAERPFAAALRGQQVRDEFIMRNTKTGRTQVLRISAAPVRAGEGVVGAVVVAADVTQRREMEKERERLYGEAQQAVADRQHALAIVSHDLRNPLNTIRLAASVLKEESLEPGIAERSRLSIDRAVSRMTRLISDLLDFSSIQGGRLSVQLAPVDSATVAEEAVEAARPDAAAHGLLLSLEASPILVRADRDRLLQALGNLLGNAIKVTTEGSISVRVTRDAEGARFSVTDTGPGIPPEDAARLFEPYWRAKDLSYKGTGLGLAITRGIVEAHGGTIWLESTPGHGATFYFTIPYAVPPTS